MQKQKTKTESRQPARAALVDHMRQLLATIEIDGGAQMPALLVQHLRRQYRVAPTGSALRRRLLAMRLAVMGGMALRLTVSATEGVVNTVSLEDAARMLFAAMGGDEDTPAKPAPLKVDFSMFGDEDDSAPVETAPPQDSATPAIEFDPFDAFAESPPAKAAAFTVDFGDWDSSDDPAQTAARSD
jgi:hypothetical protein